MKSNVKRLVSLFLAIALLTVSVVGCGKKEVEDATEKEVVESKDQGSEVNVEEKEADRDIVAKEQAGSGSVATEEDGPFGRYKEPITIELVRLTNANDDNKIKQLADGWGTVETWEDNRWTRLYKDELNIQVKYRWIVNEDQYKQKWKMAMASGDIPDVAKVDLVDLNQLSDAGLIQEMGGIWEKYASPLTREVATADGTAVFDAISIDGKMMGVPQVMAALDSYRYLWIRTDWMKKLNSQAPKTMDEFIALMDAFVNKDPDGNGKKDTYAYMIDKTLWYGLEGFFWCFEAYPDTWMKASDGSLVYGGIQKEMIQPLKTLQKMYKDGWIDKEFVVKDYAKANEMIAAGRTGVSAGGHWLPYDIGKSRENNPEADWGCFEWPSATGKPARGEMELGLRSTFAVKKDYEHPEAIVKMLNLYYEKLYGTTGNYSYWGNDSKTNVDGVWYFGPMDSFHPLINIIPYRDAVKVTKGEMAESELKGASLDYWNNGQKMWEWERMWLPGENSAGDNVEKMLNEKRLFTDNFVGASTETMVERWGQLTELTDTTITKIITGDLDAETGFNNYVADWKRIGGDKITKEINDWYKENVK